MKSLFSSIRFWLFLFLIIRLYGITNPPTEISHNWRQTFTCMVARNFEDNHNITQPSVDMEGGKKVAMEFPLFSYLIFLFNKIFGYTHWHGRLINLFITTAGLFFFYRIVNKIHSEQTAFYSTLLLTVSIYFSFARKIMPDTFSMSLVFTGVFFLFQFIYSEKSFTKSFWFLLSIIFISIGILSKIPSLVFLIFLLPIFFDQSVSFIKKSWAALIIFISLGFSLYWYGVWNPSLLKDGAIQLYFPMEFIAGLKDTADHLSGVLEKFYFSALSGYVAFAIFIFGLVIAIYKKEKKLLLIFLSGLFVFFIFILKAANFFYFHNYYIIPFVPFMALIAGFGITQIKNQTAKTILIIIAIVECLLNQQHDFRERKDMAYKTNLESLIDMNVGTGQKIILNTGPNPQQLYFANRKGWLLDEPSKISLHDIDLINSDPRTIIILDKKINTSFDTAEFSSFFSDEHYIFLQQRK